MVRERVKLCVDTFAVSMLKQQINEQMVVVHSCFVFECRSTASECEHYVLGCRTDILQTRKPLKDLFFPDTVWLYDNELVIFLHCGRYF